ncbi:tRNA (N6-threonylcarbamoyladenosine(37)-N6)-methyltransferase TrmO [Candidatus Bathyarchaeota archaeon]|nr:tRNA (N6-threonylcarbamoyladenosine(37)-N6)-methyltransferase TrmO [Candidatus Bathyarchaeota archaeon]
MVKLSFIGYVKNGVLKQPKVGWDKVVSEIIIEKRLMEALDGIEGFSHIHVLYWADRLPRRKRPLKIHPKHREDMPLLGVFATRSAYRPNPIGLTTVKLLKREGRVLRVKGLDAFDGTPVIDIKPYIIHSDAILNAKNPKWSQKLLQK